MAEELDILLQVPGDHGADFRHQNNGDEIEREVVIDRGEDLFVGCELLPVIHGQMDPSTKTPASLVVFDFRFQSNRRKKRFLKAHITVVFADEQFPGHPSFDPVVKEISFAPSGGNGRHSVFPTTRKQEVKRAVNLSGGGSEFGVNVTGGASYEVNETVEKRDSAILEARKRVLGRGMGSKNAAEWVLLEKNLKQDGIPTFMRVAIILKRPESNESRRFKATISVDAKLALGPRIADIWSVLGMTNVPPVDPVIFDPGRRRKVKFVLDVDEDHLEAVNLQDDQNLSVLLREDEISN